METEMLRGLGADAGIVGGVLVLVTVLVIVLWKQVGRPAADKIAEIAGSIREAMVSCKDATIIARNAAQDAKAAAQHAEHAANIYAGRREHGPHPRRPGGEPPGRPADSAN